MTSEQNIAIGKLGKPHGISGAFRFYMQRELKSAKKFPKHFMVLEKGTLLPWFVTKHEWTAFNEGFIWFEDITTPEKAKLYSGRELFLSQKDITTYFKKDSDDFNFLVGFAASDETAGELGIIEAVTENPGQLLLTIKNAEKEVLIPLVDDFIVEINEKKKEITLDLPEGLLEL
jgi:16S rRNA processing protein RimM